MRADPEQRNLPLGWPLSAYTVEKSPARMAMSKSPGHQKWPHHQVSERHLKEKITVRIDDAILANSDDVVCVEEDGSPLRYYFPRSDVRMELLQPSTTTTECPFKGVARYFSVSVNGQLFKDAAWSYEEPYDEHPDLKGRVAFWEEKAPALSMTVDA
jgi:uncharacterized protein (DUF427 family)